MTHREEFEKALREMKIDAFHSLELNDNGDGYKNINTTILFAGFRIGLKATKAQAVPQWIPVSERLPNHDAGKWSDPVIALSDIGLVFRLSYCGGWQRTGDFMSTGSSEVTHWIPMPKFTEDENVS